MIALAVAEVAVLPLAGAGFFGAASTGPALSLHLPIVGAAILFGATLALLEPLPPPGPLRSTEPSGTPDPIPADGSPGVAILAATPPEGEIPAGRSAPIPRRRVLGGMLALGALAASGMVVAGRIAGGVGAGRAPARPAPAADGFGPTPAITPIDDHYVVAKGLAPPAIDPSAWRLAVQGLVATPLELTLDDVRALAAEASPRTLICISNPVVAYGSYAGTQVWTGTPVAAVIQAAGGPAADARFVLWTSADGYTESIPLDVALDPRSLLAWGMGQDGGALPHDHGFPLRVLLPGRYGMKQPKWLTGITLAAEDAPGFWVQQGWDQEAVVRTWSRMDDPRDGAEVAAGSPLPVYGVAFAGERGVRAVEVSPDGGTSWVAAELEPPASALSWVRWRATLATPTTGPRVLRVRATDGTGAVQSEVPESPAPRGASGWQEVRIIGV